MHRPGVSTRSPWNLVVPTFLAPARSPRRTISLSERGPGMPRASSFSGGWNRKIRIIFSSTRPLRALRPSTSCVAASREWGVNIFTFLAVPPCKHRLFLSYFLRFLYYFVIFVFFLLSYSVLVKYRVAVFFRSDCISAWTALLDCFGLL